ncbi:hypothetical protein [Pseudanabaena sp. CCNP1317]|nr:hypothetical protein [Pseudanabaena sp. CCNP1317]MEA5487083.1 hypothetical protein [Pseudanabaena sp. CCNP1317]
MRRREAPPHTIWVLICPDTGGYSYKTQTNRGGAKRRLYGMP